jgi:hypothetical protein
MEPCRKPAVNNLHHWPVETLGAKSAKFDIKISPKTNWAT